MAIFSNVEHLKMWVHKILPLVYDDSMSYYETLCKVVAKLNEVVTLSNEQTDYLNNWLSSTEQSLEAWKDDTKTALEEKINTDLGAAIDRLETEFADELLDAEGMIYGTQNDVPVEQGSEYYENNAKYFKEQASEAAIISRNYANGGSTPPPPLWAQNNSKYFRERAEAWAVGEVYGTDVADTDETHENNAKYYATQIGASAAQITANTNDIANLKRSLNTVNMGNIVYGSSGSKVVNTLTVSQTNDTLVLDGISSATATQINTKASITPPFNAWNASTTPNENLVYPLNLISGHSYKLTATVISGTRSAGEGTGRIQFRFIDSSETVLNTAILEITDTTTTCEILSNGSPVRLLVMIARLIEVSDLTIRIDIDDITVYNELDQKQDLLTFDNTPIENSTNPVTSDGIYKACEDINEELFGLNITNYTSGYGYNTSDVIDINSPTSNNSVECMYYACSEGDAFRYVNGKGSNNYRNYAFIDTNGTILEKGSDQYVAEAIIIAPANSAYVVFNNLVNYYPNCNIYINGGLELEIKKTNNIPDYQGCKLSLLGDSFSAFEGYSTGNHNYYPNSGSDVESVNQMWWKIVADYFGMTPLVIGAWSGSCVADGVRNSYTPASSPARCEALGDSTNNPDVVLIAMGVNDYSYSDTSDQFGTWDGTTALGSESDLSDYNNTTFKTAYATMLARIQKKYPSAFIICITPWFQKRRSTDTGANYLNAIGKSINDYADAVKEICDIMHVAYIDGTNIGFNRYNYYPTYCQDTAVSSTHPNIAGQSQIAKAIIAQMKNIHRLGA